MLGFMNLKCFFIASIFYCLSGTAYATVSSNGPAYTADFNDTAIYSINLQTGATASLTTILGSAPSSIALLSKKTAYILGADDGNVYTLNLKNNSYNSIAWRSRG